MIGNKGPAVLFLGRTTLDAVYQLEEMPEEDTKVFATEFLSAPGGPAVNAALTSARMGGRPMLMSAVGSGPWAAEVRRALARQRVRLLDLAEGTGYQTPLTTVLSARTRRTIVNPPADGAQLRTLAADWSEAVPAEWGEAPGVALTDGFFLAETLGLLRGLKAAGTRILLDGGSWKPGTEELAPLLTAAVVSERFRTPGAEVGAEGVFAYFAERGVPSAAVTRGARAILAVDGGRRFEVEIEPLENARTLGAGDVLHGALAHGMAAGEGFEPALRKAARLAMESCRRLGTEFR